MNVEDVTPDADCRALMPGAQFVDAYRIAIDDAALDARTATERIFARQPRWIVALVNLRNMIVRPLGLKTSGEADVGSSGMIGIFPVVSDTPERVTLGFNDSHLDFRVLVDATPAGRSRHVTVTTLVLTHNLVGRAYLAMILPFHRLIVRTLLRHAFARPSR